MINSRLFSWLAGYETQRKRLLKKAPFGPLRDFLAVPFLPTNTLISEMPILAVDFETTGLNAQKDKLLSVGYVELFQNEINLASHYHQIINTDGQLEADNVIIHQITDDAKAEGCALEVVIESLLSALAGRAMLVHFSRIEKQFLAKACHDLYGIEPVYPIIDTLSIARKRIEKRGIPFDSSQLRLSPLRESYHLPAHFAHNALNDAIATAELFLAQVQQLQNPDQSNLKLVLQ